MHWTQKMKNESVEVKKVCPFCVSVFCMFYQKFQFLFLHLKIYYEYLGNVYVEP